MTVGVVAGVSETAAVAERGLGGVQPRAAATGAAALCRSWGAVVR